MAGAITRTVATGVDAVTVIKIVETLVATKEQADEILEAGQEAMEAGVEMARRRSIGVVLAEMISFGVSLVEEGGTDRPPSYYRLCHCLF